VRPVRGADNLMSRLSRQCGILNISQPYRPPRPIMRIALLFFFFILQYALGPEVYSASNRNEHRKHKKEMFLGSKVRPVRGAHNLTAIHEPIV
jgi:hypothetical protein